jgi:serine/threonine-protein kinase
MDGFVWCHHCSGPHELETRFCPDTGEPMARRSTSKPASVERIAPGTVIDRKYHVLGLIGRGGHSIVFEAMHMTLGQSVALKFLARESDPKAARRFEQEARLTAAISHPNVCRSYDIGALESGTRYIVMELLRGETLHQVLSQHRLLRPGLAVHIARQVLAALGAAHSARIVHRDIKPGNVFIELVPGMEPNAKVLDFGVAKVVGLTTSSIRTTVGHALGTVRYMSPEQVLGKEVDGRSDLFAVGVLLYEMLTGIRPFEGGTPPEIAAAILRDRPAPLRALRSDIPELLEQVVFRALEKDAGARYPTAEAMRQTLARLKEREPVQLPLTALPNVGGDDSSD